MKWLRFFILFSVVLAACNIINKGEEEASYIHIEDMTVDVGNTFGAAEHNITDVHVWVNNDFIGVFEVPVTIPVLHTGESEVLIAAGYQNNGIRTDRRIYPLTANYVVDVDLVAGATTDVSPVFEYYSELGVWMEDFDGSNGIGFIAESGFINSVEDTSIDSSPLTDIKVGKWAINEDQNKILISSAEPLELTPMGATMLEFNAKTNHAFVMGLKVGNAEADKLYVMGVNQSFDDQGFLEWRKFYVDLAEQMQYLESQGLSQYRLFFEVEPDFEDIEIYMDNVKLIATQQ